MATNEIVKVLTEARTEIDQFKFEEGAKLLQGLLDTRKENPLVEQFASVIEGWIGEALFGCGRVAECIPLLEVAYKMSEDNNDPEGLEMFAMKLYEAHRYLGDKSAYESCLKLAEIFKKYNKPDLQKTFENQAKVLSKGEPLNRIALEVDGVSYELDAINEIPDLKTKTVKFNFIRNRPTIPLALHHIAVGRSHLAKGEYEQALVQYHTAIKVDPYDPTAKYEEAITYLLAQRFADGLEALEKVEQLAPCWFLVKQYIWVARRLIESTMSYNTFQVIRALEEANFGVEKQINVSEKLLVTAPLAVLHLQLGKALQLNNDAERAESSFRAGLEKTDIDDCTRTRLLFALATATSNKEEKHKLLQEAVQLKGHLPTVAISLVTQAIEK